MLGLHRHKLIARPLVYDMYTVFKPRDSESGAIQGVSVLCDTKLGREITF